MKRQSDLQSLQIASSFLFGLNSSDKKRFVGKDCSAEVQTTAVLLHQSIVISVVVGDRGWGWRVEVGGGGGVVVQQGAESRPQKHHLLHRKGTFLRWIFFFFFFLELKAKD